LTLANFAFEDEIELATATPLDDELETLEPAH
jgi:hypothetical protein